MAENETKRLGAKGRARRAQIVEVAGLLFGQHGYADVTLRDIARAIGVSHPLLVHYFPSKEDLLFAVIETWRERAIHHGLSPEHTDYAEYPRRIVELARANAQVPGYIALFSQLSATAVDPSHPAHDLIAAQHDAVFTAMLAFFEYSRDVGILRPGIDPRIAAQTLIALEDGAQTHWLYFPDKVDIADLVMAYLHNVLIEPS